MLNVNTQGSPGGWRRTSETGSRSHSVQGRRSGEIMGITEEEEEEEEGEEEEEEDIEEVDDFSPGLKEGEFIEEEKPPPPTPPKELKIKTQVT